MLLLHISSATPTTPQIRSAACLKIHLSLYLWLSYFANGISFYDKWLAVIKVALAAAALRFTAVFRFFGPAGICKPALWQVLACPGALTSSTGRRETETEQKLIMCSRRWRSFPFFHYYYFLYFFPNDWQPVLCCVRFLRLNDFAEWMTGGCFLPANHPASCKWAPK